MSGAGHMIDESPLQRCRGIEEITGEGELFGTRDPDHSAELLRQPPARHDSDPCMGIGKAGIGARHQHIAGDRDFEAAVMATPLIAPITGCGTIRSP